MTLKTSNLKRQDIIKGAMALFLKSGFHAVSMEKVAQAAPVSKATLYKYFDSKDALLVAVIDELNSDLWKTLDDFPVSSSVEKILQKIATVFVDLIFSDQGIAFYRLIIADNQSHPELGRLVYKTGPEKILSQLAGYLRQISRQPIDATFAANSFFSLLKGEYHFQCLLGVKPLPSAAEKEKHVNQTVAFFIQGWLT